MWPAQSTCVNVPRTYKETLLSAQTTFRCGLGTGGLGSVIVECDQGHAEGPPTQLNSNLPVKNSEKSI